MVHLIWPVVVKKGSFKTSTQKLRQRSQMSLLSPDLKFKGCFIISTTLHPALTSDSKSNAKLSLEILPFRNLGIRVVLCGPGIESREERGRTGNPPLEAGAE